MNYNVIADTRFGALIPIKEYREEVAFGMHSLPVNPVRHGFVDLHRIVYPHDLKDMPDDATHVYAPKCVEAEPDPFEDRHFTDA